MRNHRATRTFVAIGAAVCMLSSAWASEANDGKWTMHRSESPGMVQFSMHGDRGRFTHVSDRPQNQFSGLDLAQDTQFTLTRDAGKFDFEGTLRDGAGAGSFQFFPDARYAQEMKALGFDGVAGKQMQFALHDISLSFARDIKNTNLRGVDTEKLLAFRIHGVSPKFIAGMQAAGLNEREADQFVAFRIHGVTPGLIEDLQKLGFAHPESDELIELRVHGITPEYIRELQGQGVKNLTIDKLVAMKIHGID